MQIKSVYYLKMCQDLKTGAGKCDHLLHSLLYGRADLVNELIFCIPRPHPYFAIPKVMVGSVVVFFQSS